MQFLALSIVGEIDWCTYNFALHRCVVLEHILPLTDAIFLIQRAIL
ncbi:Uncharacterised protein [Vibrio cholerae]|nr:Uncharacterised protein [Vibrio cholerae]